MKQEDNKKFGALDLGLAKLAGGPERQTTVTSPQVAELSTTPYSELFAAGHLKELVNLCERDTGAEPSLWWVKAQFALASMPVSIIAAALESASQKVLALGSEASPNLKVLARELLLEAANSLSGAGDFDLARSFIDRAELLGAHVSAERQALARAAVSALESLPRIPQSRMQAYADYKKLLDSEVKQLPLTGPKEGRGLGGLVRLFGTLLAIAGVIFGAYYFLNYVWIDQSSPALGAPTQLEGMTPALTPGPSARVAGLEHLDPMLYELGEKAAAQPEKLEPKLPAKEDQNKLNLTGPIEPTEVRQARENPEISADPRTSVQTTDPYQADPRRVLAGIPKAADPDPKEQTRSMYQALVKTQVMSEPSYKGRVVAEIRAGDQVKVEGAEGNFYKIRSKKGHLGYVLRQDVEQIRP